MTYQSHSSPSRIDFTGESSLPRDMAVQLDVISSKLRRPYVELIESLSKPFGIDLDWWVTPLASRNTYVCPMFRRLCQMVLARELAATGSISEIVVDTPTMAALLREAVPPSVKVRSALSPLRWRLRAALTLLRRFTAALYACCGRFVFSRLMPPIRCELPVEPITLVDTFIYPESIRAGVFSDRHYPGMTKQLVKNELHCVYWAPVLYGVRNYARMFRSLRSCQDNFLLAEDYLRPQDYMYAIGHFLRGRCVLPECEFQGMSVGPMLREAYSETYAGSGSIEGLLRYRFAECLSEAGVRLKRVVEWFENQEIDHGAVAGWLTFYPEAKVLGYQGFLASPNYLSMFPIETERILGMLPQTIGVMGPALVDPLREFCADLDVTTAPAFRFEALWHLPEVKQCHDNIVLLVSLPLDIGETRQTLEMLGSALGRDPAFDGWRVQVKPHPAFPRRLLGTGDRLGLRPCWVLVDGDLDDLIEESDLFVGSASSTCVQAIVHGMPVAVIGGRARPTLNAIPDWVEAMMWAVCYNAKDLREVLVRHALYNTGVRVQLRAAGAVVRERLFRSVTRPGVLEFIGEISSKAHR